MLRHRPACPWLNASRGDASVDHCACLPSRQRRTLPGLTVLAVRSAGGRRDEGDGQVMISHSVRLNRSDVSAAGIGPDSLAGNSGRESERDTSHRTR